jgi:hypothetical protein
MLAPHRAITPRGKKEELLLSLLDALWAEYRERVPYARVYEQVVERAGGTFLNDHIAFRTVAWQRPASGIFSVSRLFEALGYCAAGCYEFPDKRLSSLHFRHENPSFPKLFVSQLRAWELSLGTRRALGRSLEAARAPLALDRLAAPKNAAALARELSRPWPAPQRKDLLAVEKESQFGAWVLVHGHAVNHFTASVDAHGCEALSDIEKTVAALRAAGVPMKAEIEGERGAKLRQSATEAASIEVEVLDGRKKVRVPWTYAYFELAERRGGFDGFLGPQAAQLFEMTRRGPKS